MSNILFSIFPSENFIDLGLYQYGWERCDPAHSFGPVARNHYLFHYVISGTGTHTAQNSSGDSITYKIRSGQGFMIFPHQICTYIADNELPWEYVWLEFDGLKVKEAVESCGLNISHPVYRPRHKDLAQQMKEEMLCERSCDYYCTEFSERYHSGRHCGFLQPEPQLFWKNFPRHSREVPPGVPDFLPDVKSRRTPENDFPFHRRHRERCGIPQPASFFPCI